MDTIRILLLITSCLVTLFILYKRFIHSCFMLQLSHYKIADFTNWFFHNKTNKNVIIPIITSIVGLVLLIFIPIKDAYLYVLLLGLLTLPFIFYKQEKKTFKLTNRAKRLVFLNLLIIVLFQVITFLVFKNHLTIYEIVYLNLLVVNCFIFDVVIIGEVISWPIENYIQNKFIKQARTKILDNHKLTVVGITGSYGKTSTKFIIGEVLSREYKVCITPNSYNTPMGVTYTINNILKNIDDVFICEMGARRNHDIKELCDIAFPKIGILTSIGPQHLETFKNIKNIIKTKFELIESLPRGGVAILNYDNYYIRNYYVNNDDIKIITYGVEQENVDYYALNIHYGTIGSTFEVQFPNKERYLFKTKLLGKHNICNILAVIALADHLKMNMHKVAYAIEELSPVSHRLELKSFPNYNIIDDSFNANIEGVSNALDILNHFDTKKVIITPGMIELGATQYEHNYRFGEKIAHVCDYVVLVGKKQTKPILDALTHLNYPESQIFVTNQFNEGFQHVVTHLKENFTVLIENDLPDNYNEN